MNVNINKTKDIFFSGKIYFGKTGNARVKVKRIVDGEVVNFTEEQDITNSDENGYFFLTLKDYKNEPVIIEVNFDEYERNTSYKDLASKEVAINPPVVLRVAISKLKEKDFINITPLTEIAVRKLYEKNFFDAEAIEENNHFISKVFLGEEEEKKKSGEKAKTNKGIKEEKLNNSVQDKTTEKQKTTPKLSKKEANQKTTEKQKTTPKLSKKEANQNKTEKRRTIDIIRTAPKLSKQANLQEKEYGLLLGAISEQSLKTNNGNKSIGEFFVRTIENLAEAIGEEGLNLAYRENFIQSLIKFLDNKNNKTGINAKNTTLIKTIQTGGNKKTVSGKNEISYKYDFVDAGKNLKNIKGGDLVSLQGLLKNGFKAKSISWAHIFGEKEENNLIKLESDDTLKATFIAPDFYDNKKFIFKLTAVDDKGDVFFDLISVSVLQSRLIKPNAPEIINVNDVKNVLKFKKLKEYPDISSYEYKFTSEDIWKDANSSVIKVGNINAFVKIRVKETPKKNTIGKTAKSSRFLIKPNAPKLKKTDDTLDITEIEINKEYDSPFFYEYSLDNGKNWNRTVSHKIEVGDIKIPYALVRVRAIRNNNVASDAVKTPPFNKAPKAPVEVEFSDEKNYLKISVVAGFEQSNMYECSFDNSNFWETIESFIIKVGNHSGPVLVRVKAIAGKHGAGEVLKSSGFTSTLLSPKEKYFNDLVDIYEFLPISGYPLPNDYEYKLEKDKVWFIAESFVLDIGDVNGVVLVRLSGGGSILKSPKFNSSLKRVAPSSKKEEKPFIGGDGTDKGDMFSNSMVFSDTEEKSQDKSKQPSAPTLSLKDDELNKLIFSPTSAFPYVGAYESSIDNQDWSPTGSFTVNVGDIDCLVRIRVRKSNTNIAGSILSVNFISKKTKIAEAIKAIEMVDGGGPGGTAVSPDAVEKDTLFVSIEPSVTEIGYVGVTFLPFTVKAVGGTRPYSFVVHKGSLPPGLLIDKKSGEITGVPTNKGVFGGIKIKAIDFNGDLVGHTKEFKINIYDKVEISGSPPLNAYEGKEYNYALMKASGGVDIGSNIGKYVFIDVNETLPRRLKIKETTGVISGRIAKGVYGKSDAITIRVADTNGAYAELTAYTMFIDPIYEFILNKIEWDKKVGNFVSVTDSEKTIELFVKGGKAPYKTPVVFVDASYFKDKKIDIDFEESADTVVRGGKIILKFIPSKKSSFVIPFTVRIADDTNKEIKIVFDLTIAPNVDVPTIISDQTATENHIYSDNNIYATGGFPGYNYKMKDDMLLHNGISLRISDGVISGIPTEVATKNNLVVTAFDSLGHKADSRVFKLIVYPKLEISTKTKLKSTQGLSFHNSDSIKVKGGEKLYQYRLASNSASLPKNLNLNLYDGVISGQLVESGTKNGIIVYVKDINNAEILSNSISIAIYPEIKISGIPDPTININSYYFDNSIIAYHGEKKYLYNIDAAGSALPLGLSLNVNNAIISGAPTVLGTISGIIMRVVDVNGSEVKTPEFKIIVYPKLEISGILDSTGTVDEYFLNNTGTSGGERKYTHSVISGKLPDGITLDSELGIIYGTPSKGETQSNIVVMVFDINNATAKTSLFTIIIYPKLKIRGIPDSTRTAGSYFSDGKIDASGGEKRYTYLISRGTLPYGLILNPSSALISGTPINFGTESNIAVMVFDVNGARAETSLFTIIIYPKLEISGIPDSTGNYGLYYSDDKIDASGGERRYTYSISRGVLPLGLTLDFSSAMIYGMPINSYGETQSNIAVMVFDVNDATKETSLFTIVIYPKLRTSGLSDSTGTTDEYFSNNIGTSGGERKYTHSIVSGRLPIGITLDSELGIIYGIPSKAETQSNIVVIVSDINGSTAETSLFTIIIYLKLSISGIPDSTGNYGIYYSDDKIDALGGEKRYRYSISRGALPSGLTLGSLNALISGVPTVSETQSNIAVMVFDINDATAETSLFTIIIYPELKISGMSDSTGTADEYFLNNTGTSGGERKYTHSIVSGKLPAGITLDSELGIIYGTPSKGETKSNIVIMVFDVNNATEETSLFTIIIYPKLKISGIPDSTGTTDAYYSDGEMKASGGEKRYTYSISRGALPLGLTLGSLNALIFRCSKQCILW